MRSLFHAPLTRGALLCAVLASAAPLAAQGSTTSTAGPTAAKPDTARQRCLVVADTARNIPTPGQVRERVALRDTLVRIGRRFGVAQPTGLLFVAVDTGTMTGAVRFLDTNLPDTAVHLSTRLVERYLAPLQPGRGFQMLVRIDAEYPALAAGKQLCQPALANDDTIYQLRQILMDHHPDQGTARPTVTATLRLVVDREGKVAYTYVEKPTGDAFYDRYLPDLARRMRFYPARLNGQPFDTRIRFVVSFER
jgi:TonB family protein